MAKWVKQGLLYTLPEGGLHAKLLSHAANPLPVRIDGDIYRVFYSARDDRNRSSVGAVDIDICRRQVVREHVEPFFEFGPPGSFHEAGISIGCVYEANGRRYMLFMGWQTPQGAHWRGDIGRLIVRDDLTLEADGDEPFMGIDKTDPVSLAYPWVIRNPTGGYRMWYTSVVTWDAGNQEMLAVLNGAESEDGDRWVRTGPAVPYQIGTAQAFARPTVFQNEGGELEMWFSYRAGNGHRYRIGYATSPDGDTWTLALPKAGIDVSESGWDSDMIEYPFVFNHEGERYMLYNGNGYGKTGFGIAAWS